MQASLPFDARGATIFTVVFFAAAGLLGCRGSAPAAVTPQAAPPVSLATPAWTTKLGLDALLVGKVWERATDAFVSPEALAAAAAKADFVLLGEKHDNADHHALQAAVLASMVRAGERPTVLFEMLEPSQDAAVAAYRGPAAGLGAALDWDKSGWPSWAGYAPIADVALGAGLRMQSANLPRDVVRSIAHHGVSALPPEEATRLGLDRPLDPEREASLDEELREAHCGQLPEAMVAPMAIAQRARDGQMASRMLAAGRPAVLIAGTGHVRTDRGVPLRILAARPGARVVSVAFLEADPATGTPAVYAARYYAASLPFDFVWFTPRANDDDPCADFHVHHAP